MSDILVGLDEGALAAHWRHHSLGAQTPFDIATSGGALADRFAWCFVAGYQATLRSLFPTLHADGWASFVVSESTTAPERHPPTAVANDGRLHGTKSWVAAVAHVDQLIVKAGRGPDARFLLIPTNRQGVTLDQYPPGKFLSDLSQGSARFEGVSIDPADDVSVETARTFGYWEPLYVHIAIIAMLGNHSRAQGDDALANRCTTWLETARPLTETSVNASFFESAANLDTDAHTIADAFAQTLLKRAECQLRGWENDHRLLSMYSKGIQSRAGRTA
ncbi:MAG: hypothetical protein AAF493_24915 [Pseudomonadota bacterium]